MQLPVQRASSFIEPADALGYCLSRWTTVKQAPTTVQKLLDNTRNKERHSPGDESCEPYTEPLSKDVSFAEASDVLSNF